MRPLKILLRLKRARSRVKAFVNVRDREKPHPRQLHLGYFGVTQELSTVKERIFTTLVEKWPRKRKPREIDWDDAERKLSKLRLLFNERGMQSCKRELPDASPVLLSTLTGTTETVASVPSDADVQDNAANEPKAPLASPILPDAMVQAQLAPQTALPRLQDQLAVYIPELKGFAEGLTENAADADDLVQATLLRALGAADSFTGRASLRTWLYVIMRHVAIDYRRQAHVRGQRHFSLEDIDDVVDVELEDRRASEEAWKELLKGLSTEKFQDLQPILGIHHWIVIYLRYFEEYSYEQIAETLVVPVNTVFSRLARALSKLRRMYRVNR
jgi:RNA polymerase sigma-70 factor (ECF subfamily)